MRLILGLVVLALTACRVLDADHCANLAGDATCRERAAGLDHCDHCVAANDGCVATAPVEAACGGSGTTTSDASTMAPPSTDGESTGAADSSSGAATTTTTTTGDPDAGVSSESTESTSPASESSSEETASGPICGDGIVEGDEACDGTRLGDLDCAGMPEYADGTLACTRDCALDTSGCSSCRVGAALCDADAQCCSENCSALGVCL